MKKSLTFVGVDISKDTLDICSLKGEHKVVKRIENNKKAIKAFFCSSSQDSKVCFENTGRYGRKIIEVLTSLNIVFYEVNPLHLHKSIGLTRGKDDIIDAFRIAKFLEKNFNDLKPHQKPEEGIEKLKVLMSHRSLLIKQRAQLKAKNKENLLIADLNLPQLEEHGAALIILLTEKIKQTEKLIAEVIKQNQVLHKQYHSIKAIPGVGPILSWNMLIKTNAFKSITNPRKFACYAGVAPFSKRSGTSVFGKASVSIYADKSIKKILHLAAMRAIQLPCDLKQYYHRKVNEGKNKMSVLNAVRNKIIHRIFAIIKNQGKYNNNLQVS
jgi:transposase